MEMAAMIDFDLVYFNWWWSGGALGIKYFNW